VVKKEIQKFKLTRPQLARLQAVMDRVRDGATRTGDVKALGDGVLEVRVEMEDLSFRVAYAETDDGLLLLALHAFRKQRDNERQAVKLAKKRWREWRDRDGV
jgi:putative component of toxin-antitoxin plasmid stabilization module